MHLKLPILPHTPSRRLLPPRALTEIEYSPYKLGCHVHFSLYRSLSQGFDPYSNTVKNTLSDMVFPTLVSLFTCSNPAPSPRQQAKLSSQAFVPQSGVDMCCSLSYGEGNPSPCSSSQVAMHPGRTHFPLFAPYI